MKINKNYGWQGLKAEFQSRKGRLFENVRAGVANAKDEIQDWRSNVKAFGLQSFIGLETSGIATLGNISVHQYLEEPYTKLAVLPIVWAGLKISKDKALEQDVKFTARAGFVFGSALVGAFMLASYEDVEKVVHKHTNPETMAELVLNAVDASCSSRQWLAELTMTPEFHFECP